LLVQLICVFMGSPPSQESFQFSLSHVFICATSAISAAISVSSRTIELSTLLAPMALTPALSIVTSPQSYFRGHITRVSRYTFPVAKVFIPAIPLST
jgi:hypothetical protein